MLAACGAEKAPNDVSRDSACSTCKLHHSPFDVEEEKSQVTLHKYATVPCDTSPSAASSSCGSAVNRYPHRESQTVDRKCVSFWLGRPYAVAFPIRGRIHTTAWLSLQAAGSLLKNSDFSELSDAPDCTMELWRVVYRIHRWVTIRQPVIFDS